MSYENYDPCFPDQPVVDLYLQTWSKLPSFKSKLAFIWAEDTSAAAAAITYEQLNNSVHRISSNLLLHLHRGDTAVILCQPGLDLVEIIFGCQRAGLIAIPIFPPNPSFENENSPDFHHLLRVISQANPKAAIANQAYMQRVERYVSSYNNNTDTHLSQRLSNLRWIPVEGVRGSPESGLPPPLAGPYGGCKPEDVYLIRYTSGATAIPKPVLVTAGSAAHNVRAARKAYDLHPDSVIVSWLPQYHDCGLMFLLLTVVSGATSVLTSPAAFVKRPGIWLELVNRFRATCTPVPSFALPLVLKRGKMTAPVNLETLKNLTIINEPIYRASVEEFVKAFRPLGLNPAAMAPSYGLAENCTFVSTAWRGTDRDALPYFKKLLPSARLDDSEEEQDIEILVVNEETEEPVEDGNEGEIWISSPSNASGYLGHPSLTREVFYAMAKNRMRKCFVRTGDRGVVIGKERFLFVTGRVSDIIKLKSGREVHPHYIETAAYESDPKNLRGGCLAAFMSSGDDITVVAELLQSNGRGGERDFRDLCEGIRKSVMEEERVAIGEVVLVKSGSVPKTTSGKIRRWLSKDSLMRGQMRILMKMSFKDEGCDLKMKKMINHANDQEEGIKRGRNKKRGEIFEAEVSDLAPLLSSL